MSSDLSNAKVHPFFKFTSVPLLYFQRQANIVFQSYLTHLFTYNLTFIFQIKAIPKAHFFYNDLEYFFYLFIFYCSGFCHTLK